jgi:hypothetical protein
LKVYQERDKLKNTLSTIITRDSSVAADISAHNCNVRKLEVKSGEIEKRAATLRTAAAVTK